MTQAHLPPAAPRWPVRLGLGSAVLAAHLWWLLGPLPLGAPPPAAGVHAGHPLAPPQQPGWAGAAATPAAAASAPHPVHSVRVSTVRWIAPPPPPGPSADATTTAAARPPASSATPGAPPASRQTPARPRPTAPTGGAADTASPAPARAADASATLPNADAPSAATAPALADQAAESPAESPAHTLLASAPQTPITPTTARPTSSAAPAPLPTTAAAPPPAAERSPPPLAGTSPTAAAPAQPPSPPGTLAATDPPPSGVAPPAAARAMALPKATVPASAELLYDISGQAKGIRYSAEGRLLWHTDGNQYRAELGISAFLLGSRVQTSRGQISASGLEPDRFADRRRSSEKATHFDRASQRIRFSTNAPDAALSPGAQDRLSVFLQLAGLLNAQPQAYTEGTQLSLLVAGTGSAEPWVFQVGPLQSLALPAGVVSARQLTREPRHEHDHRIDLWLASDWQHLPARIRLTEADGSQVDQQWRALPAAPAALPPH